MAEDTGLQAQFEQCKKLLKTCEAICLTLNTTTKPNHDPKKIVEKSGGKKSSVVSVSSYGTLGSVMGSLSLCECTVGKEEDTFYAQLKSGPLQTCSTYCDVTFPNLNKEMKKYTDLCSSCDACHKKIIKEKKNDKKEKLEVELKAAQVQRDEQKNRVSTLINQALEVEKMLKDTFTKSLAAQVAYYQACLKTTSDTLSKIKKGKK